jgi:CRP/FNR family transcriptional regulator, cyclic AMP receptor protein
MDLVKLFQHTTDVESYKAGTTLFSAGECATKMYVVLEGEVEIRSRGALLERSGPGSVLGEMALLGDHKRTADVIAATDVRLTPINERRFLFLVQETPFFALHIMRVLAARILRKESELS